MVYGKKTWVEKLKDSKNLPKMLTFEQNFPCAKALESWGATTGDSVVLAPPIEVDEIMRTVPQGSVITLKEVCEKLAAKHNVSYCCSLTTGIFINISAHAAEELKEKGETYSTPYWRTLKTDGGLNPKYPGGQETQKMHLEKEGIMVIQKGKKYFVKDVNRYLMKE